LRFQPADEAQITAWAEEISGINRRNQQNSIEKLDASFIALKRASEAAMPSRETSEGDASMDDRPSTDQVLNGLIDAYFAATDDPSRVVAGGEEEVKRVLYATLGEQYGATNRRLAIDASRIPDKRHIGRKEEAAGERELIERDAVYSVVARLVMSQEWCAMPAVGDLASVAHVAAQVLAGIGSPLLPASKWKEHKCWGRFRGMAEFAYLEELVMGALKKFHSLRGARASGA